MRNSNPHDYAKSTEICNDNHVGLISHFKFCHRIQIQMQLKFGVTQKLLEKCSSFSINSKTNDVKKNNITIMLKWTVAFKTVPKEAF